MRTAPSARSLTAIDLACNQPGDVDGVLWEAQSHVLKQHIDASSKVMRPCIPWPAEISARQTMQEGAH